MNDTVVPRTRNRTRGGPLLLIVAAILLYLAVRRPATDLSDWGGDLDDALREASKSGHPVLVAFYMPGCAPCRIMDRTVLPDSEVKRALQGIQICLGGHQVIEPGFKTKLQIYFVRQIWIADSTGGCTHHAVTWYM
ncbi:MAG: thioredoxin family protein, partial [Planctomycetes bacterium]|nr:thioredoxin family protein [Planctomycetota bacterium]